MHIIRVSVTYLQLKSSFSHFKEVFVKAFRVKIKKKKDSQKGNNFFGVGPVLGG